MGLDCTAVKTQTILITDVFEYVLDHDEEQDPTMRIRITYKLTRVSRQEHDRIVSVRLETRLTNMRMINANDAIITEQSFDRLIEKTYSVAHGAGYRITHTDFYRPGSNDSILSRTDYYALEGNQVIRTVWHEAQQIEGHDDAERREGHNNTDNR